MRSTCHFGAPYDVFLQARNEVAAKAMLDAAKKAAQAGVLLSKKELDAVAKEALNPTPKVGQTATWTSPNTSVLKHRGVRSMRNASSLISRLPHR